MRGGTQKRGARQTHKRLSYTIKINRTSLDHLLLGKRADIDKMSNAMSIPQPGKCSSASARVVTLLLRRAGCAGRQMPRAERSENGVAERQPPRYGCLR